MDQKLRFTKLVATGNDFVFLDGRDGLKGAYANYSREHLAKKLCDRHFGIGADGLVIVERVSENAGDRLKWDFYNSDGSHAEMCGNASRCFGRWAQVKLGRETSDLETVPGLVRTKVVGADIVSHMSYLKLEFKMLSFEVNKKPHAAIFVNTGVPHAVVEVSSIEDARKQIDSVAALRFHPDVGPRGTNVTFVVIKSDKHFETITFERGVEDFTLSCGTGVLAAAAVGLKITGGGDSATVDAPAGRLLAKFGANFEGADLQGPAVLVFEGEVKEEILK